MFRKPKSLLDDHIKQRFHVTPADGQSPFDGVLVDYSDTEYKFDSVRVNGHDAASPLIIDRVNVSYLQAFAVAPPAVVTGVTH